MKLVVLIPVFNEASTIKNVIRAIPKKILGIKTIQVLIVDDGSNDDTANIAFNEGAKIVSHRTNKGVGASFMTGIRNAIRMEADIVVTIDGDAQFDPAEIEKLVIPILNNELDVVIGSRFLNGKIDEIPKIKHVGNKIFSKIVSWCINKKLTDTQTGFRAYSKEAILNISVVNEYTYTQEVIIDLKFKGVRIGEVPVSVTYNNDRKSRVVKNIFHYSSRALSIILKTFVYHRPIFTFGMLGVFLIGIGISGKILTIQNILIISAGLTTGLIILGIVSFMMGLFANVVFKRQSFAEKDLRHYVNEMNKKNTENF